MQNDLMQPLRNYFPAKFLKAMNIDLFNQVSESDETLAVAGVEDYAKPANAAEETGKASQVLESIINESANLLR